MSLDKFVAFDTITTHTSNQILINQMTVNTYQFISVPVCVFRICDALKRVQSVYKKAVKKEEIDEKKITISRIFESLFFSN